MREIRGLAVTARSVSLARSVVRLGAVVSARPVARLGAVAAPRLKGRLGSGGPLGDVVRLGAGGHGGGCGGDDSRAFVNQKMSRFRSLKCGDGDPALTIDLKPWTWSDGNKRACRSGLAGFAPLSFEALGREAVGFAPLSSDVWCVTR